MLGCACLPLLLLLLFRSFMFICTLILDLFYRFLLHLLDLVQHVFSDLSLIAYSLTPAYLIGCSWLVSGRHWGKHSHGTVCSAILSAFLCGSLSNLVRLNFAVWFAATAPTSTVASRVLYIAKQAAVPLRS